jgi:hypothetical protein
MLGFLGFYFSFFRLEKGQKIGIKFSLMRVGQAVGFAFIYLILWKHPRQGQLYLGIIGGIRRNSKDKNAYDRCSDHRR